VIAKNNPIRDAAPTMDWRSGVQVRLTPILSAALDAFSERGYHGTTVRDIARRVGVTVPALYYHHENKESILFDLLDSSIERLHTLCQAAMSEAGDDVGQRFLNLVEALVLYMAHSTKLAGLDSEIRSLESDKRSLYATKRRRIEKMLVEVVADGRKAGLFDVTSPPDAARALLGMFQAIAVWYRPGGKRPPQGLATSYLDIAAHAVGATPDLVAHARA
jgi:TetR/AcrR family transcriptional regulator, cholesterol catabolism regulator